MPYMLVVIVAVGVWFFDAWPFYSGHFRPLSREHDYNIYLYGPNNHSENLGFIVGLDNCQYRVKQHFESHKLDEKEWTYRCCRILRKDSCYRFEQ